jgi:hypothetical protein
MAFMEPRQNMDLGAMRAWGQTPWLAFDGWVRSFNDIDDAPVVYLSGPMSYTDDADERFAVAAESIRRRGAIALVPERISQVTGFDVRERQSYLRRDTASILISSGLVLLPGWQPSIGATLEALVARHVGLRIWSFATHNDLSDHPLSDLVEAHQQAIYEAVDRAIDEAVESRG